ncbi:transposase family protein [Kitasatospora sp. NBC_00070]|uniref:transposase family protein n=1 Tax=Kitasatospora sp. NBC_00070 TaxID=2975962 RepID=UPI0038601C99
MLAAVPDPRRVRGRRYHTGVLLAWCLTAVLGGARSLAQIARYAADADQEVRIGLGLARAMPTPPRSAGCWPASTCAAWSSPPTGCVQ